MSTAAISTPTPEAVTRFRCFGGDCTVLVQGDGQSRGAAAATTRARRRLLEWHAQFSRFDVSSELCRVNRDPRRTLPVSPMMMRFVEAALRAAELTGGLVDPTLVAELERAGYAHSFGSASLPMSVARRIAPPRRAAAPNPASRWRQVIVNREAATITRPPGVALDSGGIAKGLFGDVLAPDLAAYASFAVDAAGDIRFGGTAGRIRPVQVASPFDASIIHTFQLRDGAAATSGIGKRSWLDGNGRAAHHLLNPSTGMPAFTGIVQATALAPSAVEAEALAKAAVLSGPPRAAGWLVHGGLIVYEDRTYELVEPQTDQLQP